jgi:hypothetical protein
MRIKRGSWLTSALPKSVTQRLISRRNLAEPPDIEHLKSSWTVRTVTEPIFGDWGVFYMSSLLDNGHSQPTGRRSNIIVPVLQPDSCFGQTRHSSEIPLRICFATCFIGILRRDLLPLHCTVHLFAIPNKPMNERMLDNFNRLCPLSPSRTTRSKAVRFLGQDWTKIWDL